MHHPRMLPGRARGALLVTLVLGLCAVFAASAGVAGAAVPAPPAGCTTVFSDDFNGAADTGVNTSQLALRHSAPATPAAPPNWGTGEVETHDQQHRQRLPGRRRPPGHQADPRRRRQLDVAAGSRPSAPTSPPRPAASCASRRRSSSPTSAAPPRPATGRRSGRSARPLRGVGATNWPRHRRDRHHGGHQRAQLRVRHAPLRQLARAARATRPPASAAASAPAPAARPASTRTRWSTTAASRPEQIRWYLDGGNFFTVNANQVDATTWNNATHHGFFMILNVAIGGGFPAAFGGGPTGSTAVRRADARRLRRGLPEARRAVTRRLRRRRPTSPRRATRPRASSLSWTASTDNVGVTGYQIFRNGAQVGTSTTTSFTNTGLAASTAYSFTVKATDAAGQRLGGVNRRQRHDLARRAGTPRLRPRRRT